MKPITEKPPTPIAVVFLDFDGVLVTPACMKRARGGRAPLDVDCVRVLDNFMARHREARIVISSTWRIISTLRELRAHMEQYGFKFGDRIIGKTTTKTTFSGRFYISRPRGLEIDHWLKTNPRPAWIAIIDDEGDMGPVQSYLVRTSFETGLQSHHGEQLDALVAWQKRGAEKAVANG